MIAALRAEGLRTVMLTGDSRATAEAVGRAVGIDEIEAEVLPADKAAAVERLQAGGHRVAMAGDGINDAPALARADVGIAMGTGTDVALESAGVTLLGGDLGGLLRARRLSRATIANIKQNLFFAFLYNALGVPIAAGALYPLLRLQLTPGARGGGDGALVGLGRRQRAPAARRARLKRVSRGLVGDGERPTRWRSALPLTSPGLKRKWRSALLTAAAPRP